MKSHHKSVFSVAASVFLPVFANADPVDAEDGIDFGVVGTGIRRESIDHHDLIMQSMYGSLSFVAGYRDSGPSSDGGIKFHSHPFRVLLGSLGESPPEQTGKFEIWAAGSYPIGSPVFKIDTTAQTAAFTGLDVAINSGTLKVAGSSVATAANVPQMLKALTGKVELGNGSATGTGAVAIGLQSPSATGTSAVALGNGTASGENSFASGLNAKAVGKGTVAMGNDTLATAWHAVALGTGYAKGSHSFATSQGGVDVAGAGASALSAGFAEAVHAFAAGEGTTASQLSAAALGMHNKYVTGGCKTEWIGTDPLFTVGNGTGYTAKSDALLMLKNGKTTLTNKKWTPANPVSDPDPTDPADAGGEALVVEGHTRLRGKVVIEQRQGDISMGIFE